MKWWMKIWWSRFVIDQCGTGSTTRGTRLEHLESKDTNQTKNEEGDGGRCGADTGRRLVAALTVLAWSCGCSGSGLAAGSSSRSGKRSQGDGCWCGSTRVSAIAVVVVSIDAKDGVIIAQAGSGSVELGAARLRHARASRGLVESHGAPAVLAAVVLAHGQ